MIVLLILSIGVKKSIRKEKNTQNVSQEIHFDILFMARWFWKAIHAWKLNKKMELTELLKAFYEEKNRNNEYK